MTTVAAPAGTLLSRIHRPSPRLAKIGACIYAKGGAGKTTLLNTMPGQGMLLDVPQIEGGSSVLAGNENIDVVPIETWDHYQEAYDLLKNNTPSPNTGKPYNWVALDTISAASILARRKAVRERNIDSAPTQITQQDWGRIGQLMEDLFYLYGTLPQHVIYLSQEKLRESGDVHEYQPAISPMALEALHPSLFLIGRLYIAEVVTEAGIVEERRLRVGTSERYFTKVRAVPGRALKPILKDPNLKEIFGWLLGQGDTEPAGIDLAAAAAGNPFAAFVE